MRIGGLQHFSMIDFPKKLSCVLFTLGCQFRCHYCHNKALVSPPFSEISLKEVFSFLNKRKNQLEAVVISGGEPTLHKDLEEFISQIKKQ